MRRSLLLITSLTILLAACGQAPLDRSEPGRATPSASAPEPITTTVPTVLILDASDSMKQTDAPGPRIDAAKDAATTLIDALPDDALIGLTVYGNGTGNSEAERTAGCRDVTTAVPLGPLDRDEMRREIDLLQPSGWTPISLALDIAVAQLPADGAPQAIVLVSDGEDTCGAPPCDASTRAKRSHPNLTISTVGFRTAGLASDQLSCIAAVTGGLFVHADNAAQLTARLLATQNVSQADRSLKADGLGDVSLGTHIDDLRRTHRGFPDASSSGEVTVVWMDCDWGFTDGILQSIAPHDGGRTIDGVRSGTSIQEAVELYGDPLQTERNDDDSHTVIFDADPNGDNAYRMRVEDFSEGGGAVSGTIRSVVLCRCKPRASTEPEIVVLEPVDAEGHVQSGWSVNRESRDTPLDCSFGSASSYDLDGGVRFCGGTADAADACWPAGRSEVLCLRDPFDTTLDQISAEGLSEPLQSREVEPFPFALELDDGSQCRARIGGAWPSPVEQPDLVGYYSCGDNGAIWGRDEGIHKGSDGWTVIHGPSDGHLVERRVETAYYVGVA